jgi:hypothetical protein
MMCPLNELQLTSARRRQVLTEEALSLTSEHRKFSAAGGVAIWPKIRGQPQLWG